MAETISTKTTKSEAISEGRKSVREPAPQLSAGFEAGLLYLQRSAGNRAVSQFLQSQVEGAHGLSPSAPVLAAPSPVIQTKLAISRPGDKYEQEADRVADTVMRMADPAVSPLSQSIEPYPGISIQRQCVTCEEGEGVKPLDFNLPLPGEAAEEEIAEPLIETPPPVDLLQRMCAGCEEEKTLQAKEAPGQASASNPVVHDFSGGGQPLSESARSFFEPRFGYIFDKVRIHTGGRATESARSVNALAYTRGHDIVFAPGQYAPETAGGRRLLAHELTHVMQQNSQAINSSSTLQRKAVTGAPDPAINTIICDGSGGISVQLGNTGTADQTACLSDCMKKHEETHKADALADNAKICDGQSANRIVTFDTQAERSATEIKSSNAEIDCLKAKPETAKCKTIIKDRIKQMKTYRDSFK
jgi:uncharacterized protein DUF4157